MLFDSLEFILFLPLVIGLYYILPHKMRWLMLLIASYFFYGSWKWEFLILIVYSTVVDFLVANQIDRSKEKLRKRVWLTISLLSNFGVLFVFKYFNFFIGKSEAFGKYVTEHPSLESFTRILEYGIPVGISFYTFQTVGYTIDVYQGKVKPEKNLGKFALFVSYFPQLVAGPIERFSNLRPQIFAKHELKYENLSKGFRLILYGLFIKMVIADNIAPIIDPVFDNPLQFDQGDNILGLFLFSIQIYADFHGYSLIAIGVAKLMGVSLMDNFKTPYFSASIREFWSRWHISLSTWFRDYLYIPLGGNKVKYFRWTINILIVFIVSGIWHGANYTFIIWGAIHAVMYLLERLIAGKNKTTNVLLKFIYVLKTFVIVNIAWLFFRSDTLSKAYLHITKMLGISVSDSAYSNLTSFEHQQDNKALETLQIEALEISQIDFDYVLLIPFALFFTMELIIQKNRIDKLYSKTSFTVRWISYASLIYFILAMSGAEFYQFIYFQF